jgi:hypothetical protein
MPVPASIVEAITSDRLREAAGLRRAREAVEERPPKPRHPRRLRSLAARLAFTVVR